MTKPYFKYWDASAICDICGFKFKKSQLRKTWDGYMACSINKCWYPKHPFDDPIFTKDDPQPIPNARPELPVVYLDAGLGISVWDKNWFSVNYGLQIDPVWDQLNDFWENY